MHFVIDAVEQLDLRSARVNDKGSGSEQYPPATMLALLVYSYATGTFGSRRIEQTTFDNVAVRYLCADTHPDHDTICEFRRQNRALLASAFAQILELAARSNQLRVGDITVAVDGTKILAKAEAADSTPLQDGLTINDELARRHTRKAALAKARAEMEARAYAKAQAERAEQHPGQEGPPPPTPPAPKDLYNFTDPESRIMPAGGKGRFEQAFNAQAAVEIESRLIVAQHVTQDTNDKHQLVPTVAAIAPVVGKVKQISSTAATSPQRPSPSSRPARTASPRASRSWPPSNANPTAAPSRNSKPGRIRHRLPMTPRSSSASPTAPPPPPAARSTNNASRPSNPSSASSKPRSASAASCCAACRTRRWNGRWYAAPTTSSASISSKPRSNPPERPSGLCRLTASSPNRRENESSRSTPRRTPFKLVPPKQQQPVCSAACRRSPTGC